MIKLETIDSTMAYVKRHRDALPERGAVLAKTQTGGKGRFGRTWLSPPGGLYLTLFYPAEHVQQELALEVALLLKEFLALEGAQTTLKRPNDLLMEGKKVAGVLIECTGGRALIGIGLNVNTPQDLLNQIDQPTTSLAMETGRLWDIEALAERLVNYLNHREKNRC